MSSDPNVNPTATEPGPPPPSPSPSAPASVIENEIPAYRAIAPSAVFALVLGVLSALSFASTSFVAVAVLAIVVGFLADRKIQRFPDRLTGRGMAQAGVGLGLIFGLTSLTVDTVQGVIRARQATAFAKTYEGVLQKGGFNLAVWWSQAPGSREKDDPESIIKELTSRAQDAQMFEQRYATLRALTQAVATEGATVHFERLETHGVDGLDPYAAALYEVHAPKAEKPEDRERFALAYIKGHTDEKGRLEWWVESVSFPAKPGTFQAPAKPIDDGHGHAH